MFFKDKKKLKHLKVPKDQKQFDLTNEEFEELVFFAKERKIREMEMQFWAIQLTHIRQRIMERCGLKADEWNVDWENVYDTGKVFAIKLPKPKVIPANESKLPQKQSEGTVSKKPA